MADEFSLGELVRAVWRRKGLVALIVLGCVIAGAAVTAAMPKIYRAQTSVFFPEPGQTGMAAALGALGQGAALLPGLSALAPPASAPALCKAIAESYSVRAEICRAYNLQRRFGAADFQEATDRLRDSTWVEITPEGVLVIRVDAREPQLCADLANEYARVVERRYREARVSRARGEREFLERRVVEAKTDLARAEEARRAQQERADALLVPEEVPPVLEKLADLRVEQATAEVQLEALRRQRSEAMAQLQRIAAESEGPAQRRSAYAVPFEWSSETISDNPDIAQLRAQLVSLEVELAAARHRLTSEHPDVKLLETRVEETRRRLASEARQVVTAQTATRSPVYAAALQDLVTLETTVLGQQAKAQGLRQLVQQVEAQQAALPQRLLRYARLEREVRAQETVYATLAAQLEAARLKELQEQPVFQVLDRAVVPQRPDRPRLKINLVLAFVIGVFVAAATAAALGAPNSGPRA